LNLNQIMLAEEVGDEEPDLFPLFDKHFTAAQHLLKGRAQ